MKGRVRGTSQGARDQATIRRSVYVRSCQGVKGVRGQFFWVHGRQSDRPTLRKLTFTASSTSPLLYLVVINRSRRARPLSRIAVPTNSSFAYTMGPPERHKDKKGPRHMPARRTSGSVNMGKSRFKGLLDDIRHVLKRIIVGGRL
jgi:hypothetical protein